MIKSWPNFLLVGAPKSGSTSVANYLNEHPKVFIPDEKELFYFASDAISKVTPNDPMYAAILKTAKLDKKSYFDTFKQSNKPFRGEATVHYLYHFDEVIPKVKEELGDIKIIILLRNPVHRAFSNFNYQQRGQVCSFEQALKQEAERKKLGYNSFWYYKEGGLYYRPVKNYLENFSSVHVCFYEDLKKDPAKFMKQIYSFLGVDETFVPNLQKVHNKTVVPKNRLVHLLLYAKHRLGFRLRLPSAIRKRLYKESNKKLSPQTEKQLKEWFAEDVEKLEKLLNVELSAWYK